MNLGELFSRAAARHPGALAVEGPEESLTYGELDAAANQMARAFLELGVGRGDRVGLWANRGPRLIAAMQACLRIGAVYVPIDPISPVARAATIIDDCGIRLLVTTASLSMSLVKSGRDPPGIFTIDTAVTTGGKSWADRASYSSTECAPADAKDDDPAYILYTSGSTGRPKGVCISHENARSFVDWAATKIDATHADRFANHAPFHFDLSVFDLYVAFSVGASVHIVPESVSYSPTGLVELLSVVRPTIWYSVPSALMVMMNHGGLLELPSLSTRTIVFAGEPFPVAQLNQLRRRWPSVRLLNFYGPTETNVCTYHEVANEDVVEQVPIGQACCGDRVWAVDEAGHEVPPGAVGELLVSGPTVMLGYWGQPPHPRGEAYRTGDLVRMRKDGAYEYVGRRDHMVKLRGYRVELAEVESALLSHPELVEGAVLVEGTGLEAKLVAYLVGATSARPSLLELKRHCADRVPRYMIIDRVRWCDALPRTGNGKIDRKRLAEDWLVRQTR